MICPGVENAPGLSPPKHRLGQPKTQTNDLSTETATEPQKNISVAVDVDSLYSEQRVNPDVYAVFSAVHLRSHLPWHILIPNVNRVLHTTV